MSNEIINVVNINDIPTQYKQYVYDVLDRWKLVIKSIPNNLTVEMTILFTDNLGENVLGGAILEQVYDLQSNTIVNFSQLNTNYTYGQVIPVKGRIELNLRYLSILQSRTYSDGNDGLYYTLLHEMGHVLGILGIPLYLGIIQYQSGDTSGNSFYYHNGSNAVREYDNYFNTNESTTWNLIPVENDGGSGTRHVHPEEGLEHFSSYNTRVINGVFYPGMDKELMTGWLDGITSNSVNHFKPSLSRITIGFLEDIGFGVDYNGADEYDISIQNVEPEPSPEPEPEPEPEPDSTNFYSSINDQIINELPSNLGEIGTDGDIIVFKTTYLSPDQIEAVVTWANQVRTKYALQIEEPQ